MTAQVTSRNLVVPASLFRAIQSSVVQKPLLSRPKLIEIGRDLSIHKSCTTKLSRPRWRCRAAGFCFDASCQREKDVLFLLSLFIPVVLLAISYVSLNRRTEKENVFESRDGTVFQSPPGFEPERDKKGQLAYKAVSYTPWPIAEGSKGQRLRIKVGPLSNQRPETYVFERLLSRPSKIINVDLPRPMGIVFEEDSRQQRVFICGLVEGSIAQRRAQVGHLELLYPDGLNGIFGLGCAKSTLGGHLVMVAKMDTSRQDCAVMTGDILRACTCTNFVYETTALFGAKAPTRTRVLYGADKQKWSKVMNALKRGSSNDGDVTLVVERAL